MYIEPIKNINKLEDNKYIAYYNKRGYNGDTKQRFQEEKEKKEEKEKNKFELEENVQEKCEINNQDNKMIYDAESLKNKNSRIYRELFNEEKIPKQSKNEGLQFLELMKAYNKKSRKRNDREQGEERKQEVVFTKKQEMEEFKKSYQVKSDLDLACEMLNKVLEEKKQEEIRRKRRGHIYRELDD